MNIGLMMVAEENDILADTLTQHEQIVDCFYALDGTRSDPGYSHDTITASEKCAGYLTDRALGDDHTTDGSRQALLDLAVRDHGSDHWFCLLHADEVWMCDPAEVIVSYPGYDGYLFRLPFYVPREPWDNDVHPLDQLHWHFLPGWPEFRMFRGGPDVAYSPGQMFNVTPTGINNTKQTGEVIRHYPYRSPRQQQLRAKASFDPDNYRHARQRRYVWTNDMVADALCQHHTHIVSALAVA